MTLGTVLLYGPGGLLFLVCEVPLHTLSPKPNRFRWERTFGGFPLGSLVIPEAYTLKLKPQTFNSTP